MVKVLLFDFWGTLMENGVWSPTRQVKEILGIPILFSEYVVRFEKTMMTSDFPELRMAFENVAQEFKVDCSERQMEMLIGMWNKSWMLARPYPETTEMLAELQKKHRLVLVSNTDRFSINNVLNKFGMKKYFEKVFCSYELGLIKTDSEFLPKVLAELGATAEECVMIGDSLESDMLPAQKAGIKAVMMDRRNSRQFGLKIRNLNELESVL
ncbi:HAD family hydrolase [Candidatus Woesearchaeota archaeon]|nr:HAD family hydrolase [Candidatus Woesearchaeota archaeon]